MLISVKTNFIEIIINKYNHRSKSKADIIIMSPNLVHGGARNISLNFFT